jgi:hypothetical protein
MYRGNFKAVEDEGKECGKCGVLFHNTPSSWEGVWNCGPCGGNAISTKVTNGKKGKVKGSSRRSRMKKLQNKNKPQPHWANVLLTQEWADYKRKKANIVSSKPTKTAKVKTPKKTEHQKALESLGLTEEDIVRLKG